MTKINLDVVKHDINNISPDQLELAGIIRHSDFGANPPHGFCCVYCSSGTGNNRTGALDFDFKDDRWVHYCHACGGNGDNITLLQHVYGMDFKGAILRAADDFGFNSDGIDWSKPSAVKKSAPVKPPEHKPRPQWPIKFTEPEQVPLIKADIEKAQRQLHLLPVDDGDKFAGGSFRGLYVEHTLKNFGVGYLEDWIHPKLRLDGDNHRGDRRVIIPTPDNEHYNAVRLPCDRTGDNYDKVHAGARRVFNPDALKADTVWLVEGEFDAMSIVQASNKKIACAAVISAAGWKNTIIPMIDAGHISFRKFVILFDADDAGRNAAYEFKTELEKRHFPAAVRFIYDFLNDDDKKKFGIKVDANQLLVTRTTSLTFILNDIKVDVQKEFGDIQNQTTIDFDAKSAPVTPSKPAADKFDKLFVGHKPIRVSAGAIFTVAEPDVKPYLETLFIERNFDAFVNKINDNNIDNDFAMVYSSDGTDKSSGYLPVEQVKPALEWLITNLYSFFHPNVDRLKNFLVSILNMVNAGRAADIIRDPSFFDNAVDIAKKSFDGQPFSFDKKFRNKIIAFAKHSDDIYQSLLRFDYRLLDNFLDNELTNLLCAELLVHVQKNFLRFAIDQGTWYTWEVNHWQPVNVKSLAALYDLWMPLARKSRVFAEYESFRKYCELADFIIRTPKCAKKGTPEFEKRKRLEADAKNSTAKFRETSVLEFSRTMDNLFTVASGLPEIQIQTNEFDQKPYLFNCTNCTVNLKTMQTYPARQTDLITMQSGTTYDPAASYDVWDNFIATAIPDEELRDWLQRFFGYSLSGLNKEDIFTFINGVGGSGKTTFLNGISRAMGDYAKTFDVALITANSKPKDGNEPNPALAALRACRLARSSETERNRRLDEAKIKHFTGGEPITARELHKPIFEFTPDFKMVIDGNYLLSISDVNDRGLQRRLRIAPFNNPPADDAVDTELENKLSTDLARSAILNWCIEGWKKYQKRGLRDIPAVTQQALTSFYESNDTIADFLADHNYEVGDVNDRRYRISVKKVYETFKTWRRDNPRSTYYNRTDFVSALLATLKNDGVVQDYYGHTDVFKGFTMSDKPDDDYGNPYDE